MRIELAKAVFVSIVVKKHNKQKTTDMLKTFSLNPLFWSFPNLGACLGPASMSLEAFDEERVQQMEAETEAQEVRARWLDGMLIVRCSYSLSYNLYIWYYISHSLYIVISP